MHILISASLILHNIKTYSIFFPLSSSTDKSATIIFASRSVLQVDWSKFIAVNGATAHPHYDPDGTAYNMGNSYGRKG